jgi:hypothetical protein
MIALGEHGCSTTCTGTCTPNASTQFPAKHPHLCTEALKIVRQALGPQHRQVGLGSRAQVVQGVEHPERQCRHKGTQARRGSRCGKAMTGEEPKPQAKVLEKAHGIPVSGTPQHVLLYPQTQACCLPVGAAAPHLNAVLVTIGLPVGSRPPSTQVTQVGSPANSSLYSGVRSCLRAQQVEKGT